jgi:glutaredoxin 3
MDDTVFIYGKPGCPYTRRALRAYGDRAVLIDVIEDPSKIPDMLALSGGQRKIPVIVDGDTVTVGYGGN